MGFSGAVWPVNPGRAEMAGRPCFAAVADLPEAPDAAFLAVNARAASGAVAALAARGCGGVVCFASGFAETGAHGLQADLVAAAAGMPLLGPNCYGLINALDGALLWPDEHGLARVDRGVAIVSQSSNIAISMTMQARGLPIAYVVCAGNQAQTGLADIAAALAADPRVTAVGLYVEGLGDPARLADVVGAAGKPFVALRSGRSEAGREASLSHTGSLTGGADAAEAYFKRLRIGLAPSIPAFLETLKLLHVHGPLRGARLAAACCSGGEASLVADAAFAAGVSTPAPDDAIRAALVETLGPHVAIANPLDFQTRIWGDDAAMEAMFASMAAIPADLFAYIFDPPRADRADPSAWRPALTAFERAAARSAAPAAVIATVPETMTEAEATRLAALGVAPLMGLEDAMAAMAAAATCGLARRPARAPVSPRRATADAPLRLWDEDRAKIALAAHGLAVPEGARAQSPDEAGAIALRLGGRLAVKRLGLAHKTEVGALALDIAPKDVAGAARALGPGPYLVERMVEGGVAELILGVRRDAALGPTLLIGFGGTEAELLGDAATLIIPADEAEIRAALDGLRLAPLLHGWRGGPAADPDAIVQSALAVARFAEAHAGALEELDVNPLIATQDGAVAADALIRIREPHP